MHDFCIEIAVSWKWNQKISFFARFQNHHSRSPFAIYIWCFHVRKYVKKFHFWKYSHHPPSPPCPEHEIYCPVLSKEWGFFFWITQKCPPPSCPATWEISNFPPRRTRNILFIQVKYGAASEKKRGRLNM